MNRETRDQLAATQVGLLHLNGRTLAVRSPGPKHWAAMASESYRLARKKCRSPLTALAEEWDSLPASMRDMAMSKAITMKAGGEVEPTAEQVAAQIHTPEGCRAWVWILAREEQPALTFEEVAPLVTEENVMEVLAGLAAATGADRLLKNSPGPTSSASSGPGVGPNNSAPSPKTSSGPPDNVPPSP